MTKKGTVNVTNIINMTSDEEQALDIRRPILATYPTTDATKAGQEFVYKGDVWKYHSQSELTDLGWNTVSEGFPAPIVKSYNLSIYSGCRYRADSSPLIQNSLPTIFIDNPSDIKIDFLGLGNPALYNKVILNPNTSGAVITEIKNVKLLTSLKDNGTELSLDLRNVGLTKALIDFIFVELPNTTEQATINVSGSPGTSTCDPTIATAKGYTVITS